MITDYADWRHAVDLLLWVDFCQASTDEEATFWFDTGLPADIAAVRIEGFREIAR